MKKFFQIIGLITLTCFSFFYTEKVGYVIKEMDQLMNEIKEKSVNYKTESKNAVIENNKIIPGIYGREVDLDKSYKNMKRMNEFNENMLVYKYTKPEVSIKNNFNNYVISGNKSIMEVSLIFLLRDDVDIEYIRKIANEKELQFNFFVDSTWFENNNDLINILIKEGHNIGNLSFNGDYSNSNFIWMDTILKKIVKQKNNYCYLETENNSYLEICALNKNYTIKPSIVIKNNPTANLKKVIQNGSIIALEMNSGVIDELSVSIQYILSKGYKIVPLNELLDENKY